MADYTDLKRRLAEEADGAEFSSRYAALCAESAAAIAALEADVARMQELLDLGPLGRLGLTLRTRKALRIAGITTLDKLRQTDEATLLRIPNLGRKGLNDIRAALTAS